MRTSIVESVLFVGGRRVEALAAAKNAGLQVIYLGSKSDMSRQHYELVNAAFLFPELSPDLALRFAVELHAILPFDLAYTAGEAHLQVAARINDELGLKSNPLHAVSAANNKALMRKVLRDSPVGRVASAEIWRQEELQEFATANGFPLVLKPSRGSGSRDIRIISNTVELSGGAVGLEPTGDAMAEGTAPWLAEEFLEGREFSVETHSTAGEHQILAFTEKFKNEHCVEIGHVVPARITAAEQALLANETKIVLTALGVEEGPAHTELILTSRGPRLVETHTRPGGDAIVELVKIAAGYDIHGLTFSWLSGKPTDVAHEPLVGGAAIWFLTAKQGHVTAITGEEEAQSSEGVQFASLSVAVGDVVSDVRSSADRHGEVLAIGDDADSALRHAREAVGRLAVEVEPINPG
ncbi:ATP-grasp domain-containing protein [Streptomyces sp. HSW2009]|uniref:ATP-grasp domain-containing protein n=1 Tax=Streptomyces sp. HSW2009 TaxID=3142890 RepID=UPI0032EC7711